MSDQPEIVAILEGSPADQALTESIARQGLPAMRFGSLESLSSSDSLPSISVFVFRVGGKRLGSLLIALSRLSLDYPGVRKLAVVDDGLSIVLASYLSACSVDFLNTCLDAAGVDRVAITVRRIVEQRPWYLMRANPEVGPVVQGGAKC
jgi:hypothetical protein